MIYRSIIYYYLIMIISIIITLKQQLAMAISIQWIIIIFDIKYNNNSLNRNSHSSRIFLTYKMLNQTHYSSSSLSIRGFNGLSVGFPSTKWKKQVWRPLYFTSWLIVHSFFFEQRNFIVQGTVLRDYFLCISFSNICYTKTR